MAGKQHIPGALRYLAALLATPHKRKPPNLYTLLKTPRTIEELPTAERATPRSALV